VLLGRHRCSIVAVAAAGGGPDPGSGAGARGSRGRRYQPDWSYPDYLTGVLGTVTPISTATDKAGAPIKVGLNPSAIVIAPDGRTAYVTSDFGVTPITLATNTAGPPIRIKDVTNGGFGGAFGITPDGKTLYVSTIHNTVVPISTATDEAAKPIKVGLGPGSYAFSRDGKTAYVINSLLGTVTPISTATDRAGAPIKVGSGVRIAITPDGKTAYVTGNISSTVTPIEVATNTAEPAIRVPLGPDAIVIAP
jgi:DNA-binding beta-propeller fold protein YncE